MKQLLRLVRTVRHVKPKQLIARLHLKVRRSWRVKQAARYRAALLEEPLPDLKISSTPPQPIFPPRCKLATMHEGMYTLTFLNESRTFTHPIDWHPSELEYGTRLWLLNLHYMEFLEALPDGSFTDVIEDWIAHVLPYRPGYWLDDWNSYALSIRAVVWMQQFAKRQDQLPQAFCDTLLASLYRQLRFLNENLERDIGGNHLVKNIKALMWAGRFFDTNEASKWYELGFELLGKELEEQILGDGMHYERSPAYHAQVFADFLECYGLMDQGLVKEKLHTKLEKMAQVLVDLTHPDGFVSLFNDGGLNMTYSPELCLSLWSQITGERTQTRPVFGFEEAGYYGLRVDDEYLLVDAGKVAPDFLTAHGHGDIFAFEWTIAGDRLLVDAGVFEYNVGQRREYSRSTRAHNTVTLDGMDQCEFWSAFRMGSRARVKLNAYDPDELGFSLCGVHDGYRVLEGSPKHQRSFFVQSGKVRVTDQVFGGKGQLVESRLLLHPDCHVERHTSHLSIKRKDVKVLLRTKGEIEVTDAAWFPDFGVEYTCPQVIIRYGKAPCRGEFTLERER